MKKIILAALVIFLTGCTSTEDFTRTCRTNINSQDLKTKEIMEVNFNNKDKLTNVIITRKYKAKGDNGTTAITNIKQSSEDYNNALLTKKGIKISIAKDTEEEYVIKYYIDVPNADSDVLDIFNLQENSIKFFNKMRENNIECK